jgi:hypothetical protein
MDPNVTLAEMRTIARLSAEGRLADPIDSLERMGELIIALDEWITGGGFLPDAWQR